MINTVSGKSKEIFFFESDKYTQQENTCKSNSNKKTEKSTERKICWPEEMGKYAVLSVSGLKNVNFYD